MKAVLQRGFLWLFMLFFWGFVGCEGVEDESDATQDTTQDSGEIPDFTKSHKTGGTSWTLMVYLMADTNLEAAALADLQEMMAVGSNDQLNIVALVDRAASADYDQGYTDEAVGGLADFTSAKLIHVQAGALTELEDLGELNMGDPQVLADFIEKAAGQFPADYYSIVFWDHGGSWPLFGPDDSHDSDALTMPELRTGLEAGMAAAQIDAFSLVGFDACLMAAFEVAVAVAPYGEYLLASQDLEPGHGWDYSVLSALAADGSTSPVELGQLLAEGFKAQAAAQPEESAITLSLVDLYQLTPLMTAMAELQNAVESDWESYATVMAQASSKALNFNAESEALTVLDLGLFMDEISSRATALSNQTDGIKAAMDSAIIYKIGTLKNSPSTGLTIYWPKSAAAYLGDYDQVPDIDSWRSFVKSFVALADEGHELAVPVFENLNKVADFQWLGDYEFEVWGSLSEETKASVAYVWTEHAVIQDDASWLYYWSEPASITEDGNPYYWGAPVGLFIEDQQNSQIVMAYTQVVDSRFLVDIPLVYESGTGDTRDVVYRMEFDSSWNLVSRDFFDYSGDVVAELTISNDAFIYPVWTVDNGNGIESELGAAFSITEASFEFYYLEDIQAAIVLNATNLAGEGDYVYTTQQY